MRKAAWVALGSLGVMVVVCSGLMWFGMRWFGVDGAMYDRAAKLGMPLEPEDLAPPAIPADQNAAPLMLQMAEMETASKVKAGEMLDYARGSRTEQELARQNLKQLEPVLDLAYQAAARPECQITRDWALGAYLMFPELASFKEVTQLLTARAILRANAGEMDKAAADLTTAYKIAHHSGQEPTLIPMLVRIANEVITMRAVEVIADNVKSQADLAKLRKVLEEGHQELIVFDHLRGEITMAAAIARNIKNTADLDSLGEELATGDMAPPGTVIRNGPPQNSSIRAQLNLYLRRWVPLFEMGEDARDNQKLDPVLRQMDADGEKMLGPNDRLSAILLPVFAPALDAEIKRGGTHTATLAYLDVLAYRLRTGKLPASLDELDGNYPDPFSGEQLKYRKEGKGFRIWSIGPNRVDDGGKTGKEMGLENKDGDAVLIHPTPPRGS